MVKRWPQALKPSRQEEQKGAVLARTPLAFLIADGLEISSSNFPRFDRNLNTGEEIRFTRRYVSATNTIFHDAQHPSALVLPVIP